MLTILIFAVPFDIVNGIVYHFIYGRGDHKAVLYYGLVGNIPRIILYFIFVPLFGGNGVSLAFVVGSITNFLFISHVAKKHSLIIEYKKYSVIYAISFIIGVFLWHAPINFFISSLIIFFGSLLIYIKLHVFTIDDVHYIIYSGLPKNISEKIYPILSKIVKKIS